MQAICHRPQQWADRTLRDLASVLLLEALTRVMVFMCEKHFLTQRQEPNARGATSLTRWELFPFLYGHGLRIASHRS